MPVVYGETNKGGEDPQEKTPLVKHILKEIEDVKGNTGTWSSSQEKWHKMRMRIKKIKTFPFSNSSNSSTLPTMKCIA